MTSAPDHELAALIAQAGLELFNDDVQTEVEALLESGQGVDPTARQKLIDGATRGVKHQALMNAPLEVLLFQIRRARNRDAADLAAAVGTDEDTIRRLERGESVMTEQSPRLVATWIRALEIDNHVGLAGLRRSLAHTTPQLAYTATGHLGLNTEQEEFVRDVQTELERTADA